MNLNPKILLEDKQRAKCGGSCWHCLSQIFTANISHKLRENLH
jgi:hypothetical protein